MILLKLLLSALFPVILAILFLLLEKVKLYQKVNQKVKYVIVGVAFGGLACFATQYGIQVSGAVLNVRSASPLIAGLLFGGPSGIIAGIIGGVYRWISVMWGISKYSQLACSLATILAGTIAASSRKLFLENKKYAWCYGLSIGIITEVLHMLLLFVTKLNDIETAFTVVLNCALPMIVLNGLAVMIAAIFYMLLSPKTSTYKGDKKRISQLFQSGLFICIILAFCFATFFTYYLQDKLTDNEIHNILKLNIESVPKNFENSAKTTILQYTSWIAEDYFDDCTDDAEQNDVLCKELMVEYIVYELHIVDKDGIITWSSDYHLVGRHIEQDFSDFLPLLDFENGESDSMLLPYNTTTEKFYAGSRIMDKGAVIVSYDTAYMTEGILEYIPDIVQNRFIGQSGQMIVCDQTERIISDTNNKYTGTLQDLGLSLKNKKANTVFEAVVNDETAFCMYAPYKTLAGTYTIVAVYPTAEALFSKQVAVYITLFMEIVVFAILFINIYLLTNHVVVENIHKINASLNEITNGNLDTVIDVRDSLEFDSLSDDINSTVKTLKEYIEDAKARIDKELHFAQTIQQSALPSIFPPFPNRKDFDIYATMVAAKEVGGDFYDFYLLEDNLLAFLIADVSGKSIPGAMFMMRSKSVLKNLSMHYTNVADIFTQANAQLCEGNDADMFVTSWMGIVDFKTGTLSFANAAHNAPLIRHANGQFEFLRSKPNLALAFMDDTQYQIHEYQLQPGDELFLYTDGVTEAENSAHEFFTDERLLNALNQNPDGDIKAYCSRVKASIDEFSGEAEQFDDITMLTLKFHTFDA